MRSSVEREPVSAGEAEPVLRRPSLRERVFGRNTPRQPEDRDDVAAQERRLDDERRRSPETAERRAEVRSGTEERDHPDYFEPATVAKRSLVSGLVVGGAFAAGSAAIAASGGALAPAILPIMVKAGIGGLVAGGSTYLGGETHNLLWKKKGQERPGAVGTFVRGLVSGVTVPVGLAYRLIKGKDRSPERAA